MSKEKNGKKIKAKHRTYRYRIQILPRSRCDGNHNKSRQRGNGGKKMN